MWGFFLQKDVYNFFVVPDKFLTFTLSNLPSVNVEMHKYTFLFMCKYPKCAKKAKKKCFVIVLYSVKLFRTSGNAVCPFNRSSVLRLTVLFFGILRARARKHKSVLYIHEVPVNFEDLHRDAKFLRGEKMNFVNSMAFTAITFVAFTALVALICVVENPR